MAEIAAEIRRDTYLDLDEDARMQVRLATLAGVTAGKSAAARRMSPAFAPDQVAGRGHGGAETAGHLRNNEELDRAATELFDTIAQVEADLEAMILRYRELKIAAAQVGYGKLSRDDSELLNRAETIVEMLSEQNS